MKEERERTLAIKYKRLLMQAHACLGTIYPIEQCQQRSDGSQDTDAANLILQTTTSLSAPQCDHNSLHKRHMKNVFRLNWPTTDAQSQRRVLFRRKRNATSSSPFMFVAKAERTHAKRCCKPGALTKII